MSNMWPIICRMQISHKSQDLPVLHQGGLNSSSGVSTITKCKIIQCHVVPMVRLSWPGTDLPLVASLFLHQRRLWHLPGEATAENKIPICYLSLYFVLFGRVCAKCQHIRSGSTIEKEADATPQQPHLLAQWEPKEAAFQVCPSSAQMI